MLFFKNHECFDEAGGGNEEGFATKLDCLGHVSLFTVKVKMRIFLGVF